jgi:hypothetical protein
VPEAVVEFLFLNDGSVPTGDIWAIKKATSDEIALALGWYVKRWQQWVKAGLAGMNDDLTRDRYDERNRISLIIPLPGTQLNLI